MRTLGREIISTRQEKLAKLAQIEPRLRVGNDSCDKQPHGKE
jgi:hypothetical protein